jgi:hypothetical protein
MLNVLGLFFVPLNRRLVSKYGDPTGGKAVGGVKLNIKGKNECSYISISSCFLGANRDNRTRTLILNSLHFSNLA